MSNTKDYKLGVAILEAEVSKLEETNKKLLSNNEYLEAHVESLKTQLEPFKDLFPTLRTMKDVSKLQRLLTLTSTITEEQLKVLGV